MNRADEKAAAATVTTVTTAPTTPTAPTLAFSPSVGTDDSLPSALK